MGVLFVLLMVGLFIFMVGSFVVKLSRDQSYKETELLAMAAYRLGYQDRQRGEEMRVWRPELWASTQQEQDFLRELHRNYSRGYNDAAAAESNIVQGLNELDEMMVQDFTANLNSYLRDKVSPIAP